MADKVEQAKQNTSERQTPALTETLSALLSEVKDLKQKVTTLSELEEVETERDEHPTDGGLSEDNEDIKPLDAQVAKLASAPETTNDGKNSLLQDIASDLFPPCLHRWPILRSIGWS